MKRCFCVYVLLVVSLAFGASVSAAEVVAPQVSNFSSSLPDFFEPNVGQTDPAVRYLMRARGYTAFLTPDAAVLVTTFGEGETVNENYCLPREIEGERRQRVAVVTMEMVGANPAVEIAGENEFPGKSNYFIGSERGEWRSNVPQYEEVHYYDIYPGIDVVYYSHSGNISATACINSNRLAAFPVLTTAKIR